MRIDPGTTAPEFEAETIDGEPFRLSDRRGHPVWLSFYRYASCPLCCYRVHEILSEWSTSFASHDVVAVTVWQSPTTKLVDIRDRYEPPFLMISDPESRLYRSYGVEKGLSKVLGKEVFEGIAGARKIGVPIISKWDGPATRSPADFLIGPDGTVDVAFYGANVGQMIPLDEVRSWLESQRASA